MIWEYAGELSLHPGEFSLRELTWMVEGKRKQEWLRTATTSCAIANTWRSGKSLLKVHQFPYCNNQQTGIPMATEEEMKAFAKGWMGRSTFEKGD